MYVRRESHAVRSAWRVLHISPGLPPHLLHRAFASSSRQLEYDTCNYVSKLFAPTQGTKKGRVPGPLPDEHGTDLLFRAGYMRQAHSGIFHMLPLGLRIQSKIEALIDKHMQGALGASKLSMSSITSEALWRESGRLTGRDSEFFRFQDRKGSKFLLSPTHEEEVTKIVGGAVSSYEDLPLRLYQVSRKYRDEARPRQGLLRGREFIMKDLYTFDASEEQALKTYADVRRAYEAIFDDLGLQYLTASADSGNMGGSLSHEYHFVSPKGEDNIVSCKSCDYCVNEELHTVEHTGEGIATSAEAQYFITKDKKRLVVCYVPSDESRPGTTNSVNPYVVKKIQSDIDASIENPVESWFASMAENNDGTNTMVQILDPRVSFLQSPSRMEEFRHQSEAVTSLLKTLEAIHSIRIAEVDGRPIQLTSPQEDDPCPRCSAGTLKLQQAVEVGHTFHLGDRYSRPLQAQIMTAENKTVDMQMGCHGIGVSRLIGAMASLLADGKGLRWPFGVAPFHVAIVLNPQQQDETLIEARQLCDLLANSRSGPSNGSGLDVIIDERSKSLPWKLNDADLIGYPIIVVFGKAWASGERKVELQCRALGIRELCLIDEVPDHIWRCSKYLLTGDWILKEQV